MQYKDLSDKVVLITGGTSGMGLATAGAFLMNGAKVVIAGRRPEEGKKAEEELSEISPDVLFVQADVSSAAQVEKLISRTVDHFGKLDIAFNNAGIEGAWKAVDETSEEEVDAVLGINFKGVWLACKQEILQFKKQGSPGVIVNTSSWLAEGVFFGSGIYSASKAAIDSLTRSIAVENASSGIRINSIQPGYVDTPLSDRLLPSEDHKIPLYAHVPMGRMCKPDEIADLVLWLSSSNSSYITGESIFIDGGLAIRGQRL